MCLNRSCLTEREMTRVFSVVVLSVFLVVLLEFDES